MRSAEYYGAMADVNRHCAAVVNGANPVIMPVATEFAEACHRYAAEEGFSVTRIPSYRDPARVVLRIAAPS